jgi:hypothetical protein
MSFYLLFLLESISKFIMYCISPIPFSIVLLQLQLTTQATDNWGRTACHFAAQNNDADAVNALISRGAQIDALDSDYFTAADYTMDEEVEHVLRLPHSCNPPEHDAQAQSVPLRPSKIRTKSPPSNQRFSGEEWWFGRVAPTHANFATALEAHSKSEAETSFDLAESAILDAALAAADSDSRASLPAGEEYMTAFNDAHAAFARAETALRSSALHASIANSIHRSNLPSVEYQAELDVAEGGPARAQMADLSAYHLGEEIGQFAMNDLDIDLQTHSGLTDTMLSLVGESEKPSRLAAPSKKPSLDAIAVHRQQAELGQQHEAPRGIHRRLRDLKLPSPYPLNFPANNLEHPWEEDNGYEGYYDGDKYSERYVEQSRNYSRHLEPRPSADTAESSYPSCVITMVCESDDTHITNRVSPQEQPGTLEGCDIGKDTVYSPSP